MIIRGNARAGYFVIYDMDTDEILSFEENKHKNDGS
jgi:predicted Fe-Mo cluster-binding NifX family protein